MQLCSCIKLERRTPLYLQLYLYNHTLRSSLQVYIFLQEVQIELLQCFRMNTDLLFLILPLTVLELNQTCIAAEPFFVLPSVQPLSLLCSLTCFPLSCPSLHLSFHSFIPSIPFLSCSFKWTAPSQAKNVTSPIILILSLLLLPQLTAKHFTSIVFPLWFSQFR